MFRSTLIVISVLSTAFCALTVPDQKDMVGGRDANHEAFPWIGSVKHKDGRHCTATIVGHQTVLTAANCVNGLDPKDLELRLGSSNRDDDGWTYSLKEVVVHPRFNPATLEYDVAIIRTTGSISFGIDTDAVALAASGQAVPFGKSGTVVGFGKSSKSKPLSGVLKTATVPVMQSGLCTAIYNFDLMDTMFCAGTFDDKAAACQEGSGAPLVVDEVLVGISSFGGECEKPYKPGVYTNIASVRDWINKNLF